MRKLLFFLLLIGGSYWLYQRHAVPSGETLSVPSAAAWRHTPPSSSHFVETAAILGNRWRLEITGGRTPIVAVFDGVSLATNSSNASAVQALDPALNLKKLFAGLSSTAGTPVEHVGGSDCWHFTQVAGNDVTEVWIDTKTRFVRKVFARMKGRDLTDTYELLSVDVNAEAKRLFDLKNLQLLLSH